MKTKANLCLRMLHGLILCFIVLPILAQESNVLDKRIRLPKSKGSIYQLLNLVTDRSDHLFIYDSKVVNNEQKGKIAKGTYTVREAIHEITGNSKLEMRVIGRHILLYIPTDTIKVPRVKPIQSDSVSYTLIEGSVHDRLNEEIIPFASVNVLHSSIGTITNQNGAFRLKVPDSIPNKTIHISHVGYQPVDLNIDLLSNSNSQIYLDPRVVSIQEIIVSLDNPIKIINDMLAGIRENYPDKPSYLTSFYREGIEYKKKFVSLSEAVFKVYKASYHSSSADQVKLLKMRKITNEAVKDTIILKMKSGINASLMLDLIKNIPDFLSLEGLDRYNFSQSDLTVIDDKLAHVISFVQNKNENSPLYKGELYIDAANKALLRVNFEINPSYIRKATDMLIVKKSKLYDLEPQAVRYTVSYKQLNSRYYINHIRGDLDFKVKRKKAFFGNSTLHTWFEMVTCKIDTADVTRFTRNEVLPTRTVFAETNFTYDEDFWEGFNVILPEEKLNEAITRISSKIEETGY